MATVPSTKNWQNDEIPTDTDFNTHIRDAINFLLRPPKVVLRQPFNQEIDCEAWTVMGWDQEVLQSDGGFDNDNMYVDTDNRIIARTAGWYEVKVSVRWEWHLSPTGGRAIRLAKNSNNVFDPNAVNNTVGFEVRRVSDNFVPEYGVGAESLMGFVQMNVDDHLQVWCFHSQRNPINDFRVPVAGGVPVPTNIYHVPENFTQASTVRFSATWIAQ